MKESNKLPLDFKGIKTKTRKTQLKKERIIKNVDRFYKKCYNAYKSNYDTDGALNEAKKKTFGKKQFELVDKTDKELKLDEKTKKVFKEIEKQEKGVDKKGYEIFYL